MIDDPAGADDPNSLPLGDCIVLQKLTIDRFDDGVAVLEHCEDRVEYTSSSIDLIQRRLEVMGIGNANSHISRIPVVDPALHHTQHCSTNEGLTHTCSQGNIDARTVSTLFM